MLALVGLVNIEDDHNAGEDKVDHASNIGCGPLTGAGRVGCCCVHGDYTWGHKKSCAEKASLES